MTSELPRDRWAAQDHAVLVEATRRIEERGHMVAIAEVAHTLQLDIEDVMRSARNLNRGDTPPSSADGAVPSPDTRTRARKILDGMTGAGRHIGLAAATAVVTGQLPT